MFYRFYKTQKFYTPRLEKRYRPWLACSYPIRKRPLRLTFPTATTARQHAERTAARASRVYASDN